MSVKTNDNSLAALTRARDANLAQQRIASDCWQDLRSISADERHRPNYGSQPLDLPELCFFDSSAQRLASLTPVQNGDHNN
jgi:hypothetical protein